MTTPELHLLSRRCKVISDKRMPFKILTSENYSYARHSPKYYLRSAGSLAGTNITGLSTGAVMFWMAQWCWLTATCLWITNQWNWTWTLFLVV